MLLWLIVDKFYIKVSSLVCAFERADKRVLYKHSACDGHNGSGVKSQSSSPRTWAQRSLSTGHLRLYLAVEGNLKWF